MKRRKFIGQVVAGSSSALLMGTVLYSCEKEQDDQEGNNNGNTPPPTEITIDLSLAKNSALLAAGGYIYNQGIIIANAIASKSSDKEV